MTPTPRSTTAAAIDGRERYIVFLGEIASDVVGYVTNAVTGRQTATMRDGTRVICGEWLCHGCDAPIADGPCGCLEVGR